MRVFVDSVGARLRRVDQRARNGPRRCVHEPRDILVSRLIQPATGRPDGIAPKGQHLIRSGPAVRSAHLRSAVYGRHGADGANENRHPPNTVLLRLLNERIGDYGGVPLSVPEIQHHGGLSLNLHPVLPERGRLGDKPLVTRPEQSTRPVFPRHVYRVPRLHVEHGLGLPLGQVDQRSHTKPAAITDVVPQGLPQRRLPPPGLGAIYRVERPEEIQFPFRRSPAGLLTGLLRQLDLNAQSRPINAVEHLVKVVSRRRGRERLVPLPCVPLRVL